MTQGARAESPRIERACRMLEARGGYYACYTILFALFAGASFALLWGRGLSFVWSTDGATQHLPTLVYLRDWLVQTASSLLAGTFELRTWDMRIGLGGDMITALSFYGIGDVLDLLCLAFPREQAGLAFTVLAVARLWLAGWAFSVFARRFDVRGWAVLVAALLYALSGFAVFMILRHPHFVDPAIYLPLVCLGAEKVLHRDNPLLFVVALWLMFSAHFYFSYMVCVFAVGYVVCRLFMGVGPQSAGGIAACAGKFVALGLVAACLAAPILLPNAIAVMDSSRTETGTFVPLLYDAFYYLELLPTLATVGFAGNQTYVGVTQLGVLAAAFLFMQEGRAARVLKVACVLLLVSILVPWLGHAMNGFFYVANRHSFGLVFFACGLVAWLLPRLLSASGRQLAVLGVVGAVYVVGIAASVALSAFNGEAVANFGKHGVALSAVRGVLVAAALFATLALVRMASRGGHASRLRAFVLAGTAVFVLGNGIALSFIYSDLMLSFKDTRALVAEDPFAELDSGANVAAGGGFVASAGTSDGDKSAAFPSLYRYDSGALAFDDGYHATPVTRANSGMIDGRFYDTEYFTLTPWATSDFLSGEMELAGYALSGHHYWEIDQRASVLDLMGVRWWAGVEEKVPYGFAKTVGIGEGAVLCENAHALPIGFTYDRVVDRSTYDGLSVVDKQEALMRAGLVEGTATGLQQLDARPWARELSMRAQVVEGGAVLRSDGGVDVPGGGKASKLELSFDAVEDVELYVELAGYTAAGGQETITVRGSADAGHDAWCRFVPPGKQAYSGYDDGALFFGYLDAARSKVVLTLPGTSTYSFESVRVYALAMDEHAQLADELAAESLHDVELGSNRITGRIDVSSRKLLCLSIPFSTGWRAYVDGEATDVLRVNTGMCGVMLESGDHTVELRYATPGLGLGLVLCVGGLLTLVALAIREARRDSQRA